jgi:hypothetical protein
MTMEIERRQYAPVSTELEDFLRANPTPTQPAEGKVEFHVHHHYAPADPIPAGHIVHQGPPQSAVQKILPWLCTALLACIVLTICAAVLATVLVVVVAVLAALALLGLVIAYIINSQTGAIEARAKAAAAEAKAKARARR